MQEEKCMKNFMTTFQHRAILRAVVLIVIGIAIFIWPNGFLHFIGYLIAAYLILTGILKLYDNHKFKKQTGSHGFGLAGGIILILLAIIFLYFAPMLFSILPFLLGLIIIANGLIHLVLALNLGSIGWAILCILLLISGGILVFNPFTSTLILFQAFGIILIFIGISDIIGYAQRKRTSY